MGNISRAGKNEPAPAGSSSSLRVQAGSVDGSQSLAANHARTWRYAVLLAALFVVSLTSSLFFKPSWLWMDEALSYQFISDPSLAHLNDAIVSGMDANPPLFPNLYWLIGHLSLDPQFLRAVSIAFFGVTVALFYRFTTRWVGTPRSNAVLIGLILAFTYLNFTLATQIRAYAVFLLVACLHFITGLQLAISPRQPARWLAAVAAATLLLFTHNFGLFYLAATGSFFGVLWVWTRERAFLFPIATHAFAAGAWLLAWFPSFSIQAAAGKPHSWIPLPTLASFFRIAGELAPSVSSQLERSPAFGFLPGLRFAAVLGLFLFIAIPRLRRGGRSAATDPAFLFYLLAGWVYFSTLAIAVAVSFLHTSVFISRYLWPSHLLLVFQLVYAFHHCFGGKFRAPGLSRLLPLYFSALAAFVFLQNRKVVVFPFGVVDYLAKLSPAYPVFVETADYFLPLWFHEKQLPVRYLLDWESAARPGNILSATVEHQILKSFAEKYSVPEIVKGERFNAVDFPRFYVVDEASVYGLERQLETGRIKIIRQLPMAIEGHRLLECAFAADATAVRAADR